MFFSKVVLFTISLGALAVLATPHALHHHALHRRVVAARAASSSNSSIVSVKRQNSAKCIHRSAPPSSSAPSSTHPAVSAIDTPQSKPSPTPSFTPSPPSPTSTPHQQPPPPPPATTSATPPATTSTAPPSSGFFSGDGTFFATGLGACGIVNVATDFIVAVSHLRFDAAAIGADPNDNPLCKKLVSISFGGETHTATITDRCAACLEDDLDMTTGLFQIFANLDIGRIHGIKWRYID